MELEQLYEQMEEDPGYVQTVRALEARFTAALPPVSQTGTGFRKAQGARGFDALQVGDIMLWTAGNSFINGNYANPFSHAGIYLGDQLGRGQGKKWVMEAWPITALWHEGVWARELDRWKAKGIRVALGRIKNGSPLWHFTNAVRTVNTYGVNGRTGYNSNPGTKDKDTTIIGARVLYCSQLVWKNFIPTGIDLDSNDAAYHTWVIAKRTRWVLDNIVRPGVMPDEIRASPYVVWYYDQVNP